MRYNSKECIDTDKQFLRWGTTEKHIKINTHTEKRNKFKNNMKINKWGPSRTQKKCISLFRVFFLQQQHHEH